MDDRTFCLGRDSAQGRNAAQFTYGFVSAKWLRAGALALTMVVVAGCIQQEPSTEKALSIAAPSVRFEIRKAQISPDSGLSKVPNPRAKPEGPQEIYVHDEVAISNDDLTNVELTEERGRKALSLTLTKDAAERLATLTTRSAFDQALAIFLDGELIAAPTIGPQPFEGREATVILPREWTDDDAQRIADGLLGNDP